MSTVLDPDSADLTLLQDRQVAVLGRAFLLVVGLGVLGDGRRLESLQRLGVPFDGAGRRTGFGHRRAQSCYLLRYEAAVFR